ncbi:MAG: hypothetical protein KBC69_01625 [Candidatus Magasanikbacteria bacterium]|nr:hypothetical protein [Candidatus Magasanikbacteria bacterium]
MKNKKLFVSSTIIVLALSFLFFYKAVAANIPPLKEGTYLVGQTLSVWPSWSLLGTALGQALPTDPINQLGLAGTCAVNTNRFCLNDSQCEGGEACILHDPTTGWSTADRRFSFACNRESYAYRYIVSSSTGAYTIRAHFEDTGITPNNFNSFVASFVSTSVVKINEDSGVCNFDQEISTVQSGVCGDGKLNLDKGEQCDPQGRVEYQAGCVGSIKNLKVCNSSCQWVASTTLCSNLSSCGNGVKESGETCDDGNLNGKYNHCNLLCTGLSPLGRCGNGTVESAYEVCDSGLSGQERYSVAGRQNSCAWDCQNWGPYCGDNIVQTEHGESCEGSQVCTINNQPGIKVCTSDCKKADQYALAWWQFEELKKISGITSTPDNSVNDNDAKCDLLHCPLIDQGRFGNGLNFGSDINKPKYLQVSDHVSLLTPESISVEAWVKPVHYDTLYARVIEKGGPGVGVGYGLELNASSTGHTARFNLWNNGLATGVDSNTAIALNVWTHIVGTFERVGTNNIAKIYINGNLENTKASTGPVSFMNKSNTQAIIGASLSSAGNYTNIFSGSLDEIKIYKRVLSEDEVRNSYQGNWFCLPTTTPVATNLPSGSCGNNIVDANEACDRGVANNGRACTPAYGQSCSYCSADCQNSIDVQPSQYCGNGIIENSERCDMAGGVIYASTTSTNSTTLFTKDLAHNGYQELECANEPYVPHTLKKGTKTCGDCSLGVVRNCVSCGVDSNGVSVSGGLINVLASSTVLAAQKDPLFTKELTSSSIYLSIGYCQPITAFFDFFTAKTNCDQNTLGSPLVGKAIKDQASTDFSSYSLLNPYAAGNALVSSNPTCSAGEDRSKKYLAYLNRDLFRPFDFTVVASPASWQYDFVLSPIIRNTVRNNDLRIVVSWVGPEDFFGGVVNPFVPNPEITGASYCNTSGLACDNPLQKKYSTGVTYYNTPNARWYGIWYHGFNSTVGQTNAESFTVDIGAMEGDTYSFYVKSPSVAIRQFKNTARMKVDVYLPENDINTIESQTLVESGGQGSNNQDRNFYRFGTPVKTFYFQAAAPSDNQSAKYWQVFNINKPSGSNLITDDDILNVNTIVTNPANFIYAAPTN